MTIQYGVTVRDNQLDQIEVSAGAGALLRLYTGAPPADCGAAASGTKLVEMALPSDYMNGASAGTKTKLGTWSGVGITGGTAGHFRLYDSGGTTCHMQGTVGQGSGDLSLDNAVIATSQVVTVAAFTITAGNP